MDEDTFATGFSPKNVCHGSGTAFGAEVRATAAPVMPLLMKKLKGS
jgi:hypothetical protein